MCNVVPLQQSNPQPTCTLARDVRASRVTGRAARRHGQPAARGAAAHPAVDGAHAAGHLGGVQPGGQPQGRVQGAFHSGAGMGFCVGSDSSTVLHYSVLQVIAQVTKYTKK